LLFIFRGRRKNAANFIPAAPLSPIIGDRCKTGPFRMNELKQEIAAFLKEKESRALDARQMAALQMACHFDLGEALSADPATRARIALKLERLIERERQRGARKHWSYDLNRHIALKQALDRLRSVAQTDLPYSIDIKARSIRTKNRSIKENGARRRRSKPENLGYAP